MSCRSRAHAVALLVEEVVIGRRQRKILKNIFEKKKEIDLKKRNSIFYLNVECHVNISRAHAVALLLEGIGLVD